jgi:hypothetical protein
MTISKVVRRCVRLTAAATLAFSLPACVSTSNQPGATQLPQVRQQTFSSATGAADALIRAAADYDVPKLLHILGRDSYLLIASADPAQDRRRAVAFATRAQAKHHVVIGARDATILVGPDFWPLPIPLVKEEGRWRFDSAAGRDEILKRRVGANELDAINICRGFVEAEQQYAAEPHDDSGINEYARRLVSQPGKHDGLAWRNEDGTWGGPVGERVAEEVAQGSTPRGQPYRGYHFKLLRGQGPNARLGKLDYVVEGAMIGGFALVAWPAQYRVTGVETFIVSYDGIVYQKDLGPETASIAERMDRYDPDATWKRTDDDW